MLPDALHPAGPQAAAIAQLSWALVAMFVAVTLLVVVASALALWGGPRWRAWIGREGVVLVLGVALPVVVLTALLVWGLLLTRALVPPHDADALRLRVSGEQWWWRVTYLDRVPSDQASVGDAPSDDTSMQTANELVIPTDRVVEIELVSPDVIHSFWVPRLSGKTDAIPGIVNRLAFTATRAGVYRGYCAEYCGGPHAHMGLRVIAVAPERYARWRAAQARDAATPRSPLARRGAHVFDRAGCGGCHAVRGTQAVAMFGPDLTHVGSRHRIGGGLLANTPRNRMRWIASTQHLKPGVHMPAFRQLPREDVAAIAAYLGTLQ